jgi:hypothetical protein
MKFLIKICTAKKISSRQNILDAEKCEYFFVALIKHMATTTKNKSHQYIKSIFFTGKACLQRFLAVKYF